MGESMDEQLMYLMGGIGAAILLLVIILIVWIAIIGSRLKKLRKQYVAVMGNTGISNLEDVILELKQKLNEQEQQEEKLKKRVDAVESELPLVKGKIGIIRYNAFSEGGSDLSFSLAIVNEEKDGVVFSGLHGRDNTYMYAKPLQKGESNYPLTPEEKQVILLAK
jgi:ABC-type lipoprotein release transport system permease subunit